MLYHQQRVESQTAIAPA